MKLCRKIGVWWALLFKYSDPSLIRVVFLLEKRNFLTKCLIVRLKVSHILMDFRIRFLEFRWEVYRFISSLFM